MKCLRSIIFLGFAISEKNIKKIIEEDRYPQIAANKLQWNIINGIENCIGFPTNIISAFPVSNFPGYPKICFKFEKWNHRSDSEDKYIPFINIIIVKHITRFISSLLILIWEMIGRKWNNNPVILIYSLHSPFMLAATIMKMVFGVRIAVMVPDMPEYMDLGKRRNIVRRLAKAIDARMLKFLLNKMDGMIVLTRHIAEDFPGDGIPSMVMEGAVSFDRIREAEAIESTISADDRGEKIIMYSGALTGIGLLLDSFSRIHDSDYRLWISGRGEMETEIRKAASNDARIVYWGVVPDTELMRLQLRASVLVNVRSAKTPFIRYSFPSKLLEYMAVGRPVLTTALPGIPEEYHDHLFLLKEETPEALADLLTGICSKSWESLIAYGKRGQEFVREYKNNVRQGERICLFLASL